MRITFNRNEFLQLLDQRLENRSQFGNVQSISKLIFKDVDVYDAWYYLTTRVKKGVYIGFRNYKLVDFICFVDGEDEPVVEHLDALHDMLNHVTSSENGEFFITISASVLNGGLPIFSFSRPRDDGGEYVFIPTCSDWARCIFLEEGRRYSSFVHHDDAVMPIKAWLDKKKKAAIVSFPLDHRDVVHVKANQLRNEAYNYRIIIVDCAVDDLRLYLNSGSCVIVLASDWRCWYSDLLKPFVHYIPMTRAQEDVETTLAWCFENGSKIKTIADNAGELYKNYLCKSFLVRCLNDVFLKYDNTIVVELDSKWNEFIARRVRPVSFTIPWLSYDVKGSCDVSSVTFPATLSHRSAECCFFQAMVQCFYMQWHHGLYATKNFNISIEKKKCTYSVSELYDHVFTNASYCVTTVVDASHAYYINEDGFTNYPLETFRCTRTQNNIVDVCDIFEKRYASLKRMCVSVREYASCHSFRETYDYIFLNFYRASEFYERRLPTPFLCFKKGTNTNILPISFDLNTNKLVVYRHYQILKNTLSKLHREYYETCLRTMQPSRVHFCIMNMNNVKDIYRIKYRKRAVDFDLPSGNDAIYQRLLIELDVELLEEDRVYYQSMFKDLLKLDKIKYSINYALLKTIKTFTEQ